MAENSYRSIEDMSYGAAGSGGPSGSRRLQLPQAANKKIWIIGGGVLALVLAVVLAMTVFGGTSPKKTALEYARKQFTLRVTKKDCDKWYPKKIAQDVWEVYKEGYEDLEEENSAQMKELRKAFSIEKLEVIDTEHLQKSELSEYEDNIGRYMENPKVTSGDWVNLKMTIKMDGDRETTSCRLLVLTCNGKTGVWAANAHGNTEYIWSWF